MTDAVLNGAAVLFRVPDFLLKCSGAPATSRRRSATVPRTATIVLTFTVGRLLIYQSLRHGVSTVHPLVFVPGFATCRHSRWQPLVNAEERRRGKSEAREWKFMLTTMVVESGIASLSSVTGGYMYVRLVEFLCGSAVTVSDNANIRAHEQCCRIELCMYCTCTCREKNMQTSFPLHLLWLN
jgi:hypothetical protein